MIFWHVCVCVQTLQLIAPLGKRVKEAGLFEQVGGIKIALLPGDSCKVGEDFIHTAVLHAQHALALIAAEA